MKLLRQLLFVEGEGTGAIVWHTTSQYCNSTTCKVSKTLCVLPYCGMYKRFMMQCFQHCFCSTS
jgi:hypothetical protein